MSEFLAMFKDMWWVALLWLPIIVGVYWYWNHKRNKTIRHQAVFLPADMTVVHEKLQATSGFLVDERSKCAWFLDPDALIEDEDGNMHLVLSEDSAIPHFPGMSEVDRLEKARAYRAIRTTIAEQHLDQALLEVEEDPQNDWFGRAGFVAVMSSMALILILVCSGLAAHYF